MAPKPAGETSSAPLADWFFICGQPIVDPQPDLADTHLGVDSDQLRWGNDDEDTDSGPPVPVEPTIEEDKIAEAENGAPDLQIQTPRRAKRSSYQRLSNLSDEARLSISSLSISPEKKGTESNRSSVTIKGIQTNVSSAGGLNDTDFEHALRKFASQRESFLSDLTLSAGAVLPNRPKPRPKTQRIVSDDAQGPKSGIGSIRRRISTRNLNGMKRQSSVKRQCKRPICCSPGGIMFRLQCSFKYGTLTDHSGRQLPYAPQND